MRRYFYAALEFLGYTLLLALLGTAAYLLMRYHPDEEGSWYIMLCLIAGAASGLYALQEYRRYRIISRRLAMRNAQSQSSPAETAAEARARRRLLWSERIGATPIASPELDPTSAEAMTRTRAELMDPENEADPAMSIEAIRTRIAERMAREDAERDEAERLDRRSRGK